MLNQRGYVLKLVLIVFAILIGMMIFPLKFPQKGEAECIVGEPGDHSIISGIPAIKDIFDDPFSSHNDNPDRGGPDPDATAEYVQLRRNVPTSKKSTPGAWEFLGGSVGTNITHTINVGELPEKPGYDVYYPSKWGEMDLPGKGRKYIRGEGLLIFTNNDPATIRQEGDNTIYLTDIYQDKRVYDFKGKGYSENDLFLCGVDTKVGSTFVVSPAQLVSQTKDQLQLEWFIFNTDKVWGVHCKPAVYLYPLRKQLVNVKVFPKGELSYTDPPYDRDVGWLVRAFPDGQLLTMNDERITNNYLYYESKLRNEEIEKPKEGWVVKFDELENLYNRVLPKLGLNEKEKSDFTQYWLKTLPESPYYFVGLIEKPQRDYLETLQVTPDPDTSIRFSLYFEALDQPISVPEPAITTPRRSGFTLVDWGGMVKLHPGTQFTCSQ